MTKGCRAGTVTKPELRQRLSNLEVVKRGDAVLPASTASLSELLGHAIFYNCLSEKAIDETVPRQETTVPCYLRPWLRSTPPGFDETVEQYVRVASRLFRRGSIIANEWLMEHRGGHVPVPPDGAERFDLEAARAAAAGPLALLFTEDIRNGAFKQVFLPERWPSKNVPRHPDIARMCEQGAATLPSLPDWRGVMTPTGWDNAINRMATKYHGNIQVHSCVGLSERTARYLRVVGLDAETPRNMLSAMVTGRLRPLAISEADFTMAMDLRSALGVSEKDITWYPPQKAPWTRDAFSLHLFVTRHGPDTGAYLPVASRGRKYCYLDAKITRAMLKKAAPRASKKRKKRKASTSAGTARGAEDDGEEEEATSESIGDILGFTPDAFKRRNREMRKEVRKRLRASAKNGGASRQRKRLKARAKCLGYGRLHPNGRIDSVETDGVGLRLCVKVPIDISAFVKPLPTEEEAKKRREEERLRKKRKASEERERQPRNRRRCLAPEEGADAGAAAPVILGIDRGRKKPMVAAISQQGWRKPETFVFTRSRYYSEMGYWRHRSWSMRRAQRPEVAAAVQALSVGGGLNNCDQATWETALAAERAHEAVLDAEFVDDPEYALWRMRLFRKKKRSLDRAANELLMGAVKEEPLDRPLVVAIGDASMASTGPGELAAPTSSLTLALKRAIARVRESGRKVVVGDVWEFRTTLCCCACGAVTRAARVTKRTKSGEVELGEDGAPKQRPSRRMRSCTSCEQEGKRRDRDVQAARNILWLAQHEYFGAPRPSYLCRDGQGDENGEQT